MISEVVTLSHNQINNPNFNKNEETFPSESSSENNSENCDECECEEYIDNCQSLAELQPRSGLDVEIPSFGNVSVTNSNDVHFGNKTFYQGPVTIKQFLVAHGENNGIGAIPEVLKICDSDGGDTNKENNLNNKIASVQPVDNPSKGFERLWKFSRENLTLLVSLFAVLLISLLILTIVLLLKHSLNATKPNGGGYHLRPDSNEQDHSGLMPAPLDPESNLTLPEKLRLTSRVDWVAQPPTQPLNPLPVPVPYVIIHQTASTDCLWQTKCRLVVRNLQYIEIEAENQYDIRYNFLVGGDGEGYIGRGWESEGAHTFNYNTRSIGIAFIGTFRQVTPPEKQIIACKKLIAMGIEQGFIRKNYKLFGARQLDSSLDKDNALYEEVKTWDHWAESL